MPHKKNPDVFELVRARCNQVLSLPNEIAMVSANLPSGYHRDMQLLKELLFPAITNVKQCLRMVHLMITNADQYLRDYAEAGADCLYAPGVGRRDHIAAIVEAVAPRPVAAPIGLAWGPEILKPL